MENRKWKKVLCQSTKLAWHLESAGGELELNSTMEADSP